MRSLSEIAITLLHWPQIFYYCSVFTRFFFERLAIAQRIAVGRPSVLHRRGLITIFSALQPGFDFLPPFSVNQITNVPRGHIILYFTFGFTVRTLVFLPHREVVWHLLEAIAPTTSTSRVQLQSQCSAIAVFYESHCPTGPFVPTICPNCNNTRAFSHATHRIQRYAGGS